MQKYVFFPYFLNVYLATQGAFSPSHYNKLFQNW